MRSYRTRAEREAAKRREARAELFFTICEHAGVALAYLIGFAGVFVFALAMGHHIANA